MNYPIPGIVELARVIRENRLYIARTFGPTWRDQAESGKIDVSIRLQVTESGWSVLSGDPQYDQDHRGHWGASSLEVEGDQTLAEDLISQVEESIAESGGE